MASPSQSERKPVDQEIPHPIPGLNELGPRISYGRRIQGEIQFLWPDFTMRMEQHALLLIADPEHFEKHGSLSTNKPPPSLKRQLEEASPLAKHYWMHHLLPYQPADVWEHALYRAPIYRPNLTVEDYQDAEWETFSQTIYYAQRFRTDPKLETVSLDPDEVRKCLERDQSSCVVTHQTGAKVFPFIPIGWNNSVENNNATGTLKNAYELGKSHKAWNLVCVSPDLYSSLRRGWCGFKYHETIPIEGDGDGGQLGGRVQVVLVFYWMPQLSKARFNEVTDATDLEDIARSFNDFVSQGCKEPSFYPKQDPVPRSGDKVYLPMIREDAEKLKSAVKVHWACVVYLALCGGTGRPQYLTGMNQSDGSLQPRDNEFALHQAAETSKAPGDRSHDLS
ncbi:uncharacterized protein FIESC28_01814 [Fusarium coffeatum]|uniref:Uncharacterized protein n=1 Tax=Fusarium coffeatum TaxID=231269 RepID=A0A366S7Q9_9HYPO|nr:uncharacterized protein FIESC28_01814 [Fusarium coffeatum]RBR25377.1 hypothetical protein FIESC28_01814 [Fusarium coffeatum]